MTPEQKCQAVKKALKQAASAPFQREQEAQAATVALTSALNAAGLPHALNFQPLKTDDRTIPVALPTHKIAVLHDNIVANADASKAAKDIAWRNAIAAQGWTIFTTLPDWAGAATTGAVIAERVAAQVIHCARKRDAIIRQATAPAGTEMTT